MSCYRVNPGDPLGVWRTWVGALAKLDSAKEELGWLKVLFAILAAVDVSLVAWVSQAYDTANHALLLVAIVAAVLVTAFVLWINHLAYRKINELKDL